MNEKPRKPVTLTGRRNPDDNRGNSFRSNDNERPTYHSPSDNEMQFRAANKFNENRGYGNERSYYGERRDHHERPRRYDNDRPRQQYADRPRTPENDARARDQEMRRQNDRPRQYGERSTETRYDNRSGENRSYDNRRRHNPHGPRSNQPTAQNDIAPVAASEKMASNDNPEHQNENGDTAPQRRSRLFRLHMQSGAPTTRKPREENAVSDQRDAHATVTFDKNNDLNADNKPQNAQRGDETRIFGVNACRAVFQNRPDAIVRMYVAQNRIPQFTEIMKFCAASRRAYHVIPEDELINASGSEHHEGICMLIKRRAVMQADEFLAQLPDDQPCAMLILENIGNPHNLGAILRSAAHFGVDAVFINAGAAVHSGATARVAEGGVEHVTLVEYNDIAQLLENLRHNFIKVVTTSSHQAENIYAVDIPRRSAIFFGEEHRGLTRFVLEQSDVRVGIPGTGKIESLNVGVAAAVVLSEVARRRPAPIYAEAPPADIALDHNGDSGEQSLGAEIA